MDREATWSFREGEDIIESKGLLEELPMIADAYATHGGGNQNLSERREILDPVGLGAGGVSDVRDGDGGWTAFETRQL